MTYLKLAAMGSVLGAVALTGVGCSPTINTKIEKVSSVTAKQLVKEGKTEEAAAQYARIGELLLLPEGFGYADEMFDKALALDPKNGKANFYSALTKPLLTAQGFIPRLEPIVGPDQAQALQRMRNEIAKLSLPELTKFATQLPQGKKAFANYHDLQRALRTETLPVLALSADKIDKISNEKPLELTINLARLKMGPSYSYSDSNEYSYCEREEYNNETGWTCTSTVKVISYFYNSGADLKPTTVLVDPVDLKLLKSSYMAAADYIRMGTAYSAEGFEAFKKRYDAMAAVNGNPPTAGELVSLIREYTDLGVLESDHELVQLARSAEEILKHGLDLANMQNELCGNEGRKASNSLFKEVCISAAQAQQMQIFADMLAGPKKMPIGMDGAGNPVNILTDLSAVLNNPPKDVKALLPTAFDASGKPTVFPDPTMGGLFPDGDLAEKLRQIGAIQ